MVCVHNASHLPSGTDTVLMQFFCTAVNWNMVQQQLLIDCCLPYAALLMIEIFRITFYKTVWY
jgi:hypothetical protein